MHHLFCFMTALPLPTGYQALPTLPLHTTTSQIHLCIYAEDFSKAILTKYLTDKLVPESVIPYRDCSTAWTRKAGKDLLLININLKKYCSNVFCFPVKPNL
ncbi:hypothetical protein INR49_021801 [Caranx melampygus]|nr:hypothetical protein INR49_021801 [Caranx melampygus]